METAKPTYFMISSLARAVVRTGAKGAIASVDFGKEDEIAPVVQTFILVNIYTSTRGLKFLTTSLLVAIKSKSTQFGGM